MIYLKEPNFIFPEANSALNTLQAPCYVGLGTKFLLRIMQIVHCITFRVTIHLSLMYSYYNYSLANGRCVEKGVLFSECTQRC